MKKQTFYIVGLLVLISCLEHQTEIKDNDNVVQEVTKDSLKLQLLQSHLNSKIKEPFHISKIDELEFISGDGEAIENHKKCDTLGTGFYGSYSLIDKDFTDKIGSPVGGRITVHSNNKMSEWKSTDKDQTIWKIHLKSDVISVWDSIKVGMKRSQIEAFGKANNGFCVKKGSFFYSCDFNNFSVVYIFQNDTLKELTVTRECEKE